MGAMTIAEPWPAAGQLLTADDLDLMSDDGRRYELIDGVLVVSPAPSVQHQLVLAELIVLLHGACPAGLLVVPGPGVRMSADTELIESGIAESLTIMDLMVFIETDLQVRLDFADLNADVFRTPAALAALIATRLAQSRGIVAA